jgi:tetratricopeptide (TPR) repeat protein
MSSTRIEVLQNMLLQDPNNSFARYGVAMEYKNSGRLQPAAEEFEKLIAIDPNYVAAYFHGGQTLEKLGRIDDARAAYERGITACSRIGDAHTRSEIQASLDLL